MRRLLAFITIAMLALAANAQQSPTNTDAVRSKLTMRGYKAFYDVNYLFTIYPSDTDTGNSLGFSTSHGFQFNNHLYFGGGIGFNSFFCDGTTRLVVPIFGELRCTFQPPHHPVCLRTLWLRLRQDSRLIRQSCARHAPRA